VAVGARALAAVVVCVGDWALCANSGGSEYEVMLRVQERGAVLVLAAGALSASALGQASFTPLGGLGGFPAESRAWGVSADGQVVVGGSASPRSGTEMEGFRFVGSGPMEGLGALDPTFFASIAYGVSRDGNVAVGGSFFDATRVDQAFRWVPAGGGTIIGLGGFPPAPINTTAYGVNEDGTVVVGVGKTQQSPGVLRDQAWVWSAGSGVKTPLGFLNVPNPGNDSNVTHRISWANSVSADGVTVAGFSASNVEQRAVRWELPSTVPQALSGDTTTGSLANAISADGRVVVGYAFTADFGISAFRWSANEGFVLLGDLPGVQGPPTSQALGVSGDGSVIVGNGNSSANNFNGEAFVWDFGGMRPLKSALESAGATGLSGWQLWWATGVSADGQTIVGYGRNPQGRVEAFRAFLPRCDIDFNRDGFVNLDDLGDFITDYYVDVAIPGGLQPAAPVRGELFMGLGKPCPFAGDAPLPYAVPAYRESGFRVGFSSDGSNDCPFDPVQLFPNLDNLNDYITAFYGSPCPPR
jgi:probable HAF family extracellular repeat protein